MWADSLLQTNFELHEKLYREMNPLGQAEYKPLGGLEREYLFRNINAGETIVARIIAGDHYWYTEPTEMPVWQILSETKELLGYSCQLATCDFRGRQWYAWFSTDIPVNEGPWKLFGLPGLVLEAWDSKKHYAYKAVGLYTQNLQPVGIRLYVRNKPFTLKSRQAYLQKDPSQAQYDYQERDYPHK